MNVAWSWAGGQLPQLQLLMVDLLPLCKCSFSSEQYITAWLKRRICYEVDAFNEKWASEACNRETTSRIHLLLFCVLGCIRIPIPQHIYCNSKTHLIWTALFKRSSSCDLVHSSRAQTRSLTQTMWKTNYPAQYTQHKCTCTQVYKLSLCV